MSKRCLKQSRRKIVAFVTILVGLFGLFTVPSLAGDGAVLANGGCHCGHRGSEDAQDMSP